LTTQDIKALFGYLILLAAVVGFIFSFTTENYLLATLFIIGGIVAWMIFINIANVRLHRPTGAILIIFGILLSFAIFMAFGIEQDMWGGYHIKSEGAILSLVVLFLSIMPGLIFYYFTRSRLEKLRPTLPPQEAPSPPAPAEVPPPKPEEGYKYPDWEDYEYYYDPEALAAYYGGEEYEEEEEDEEEEEEEA
jgi:drug/metabolite transporter superfamily protein YnfA